MKISSNQHERRSYPEPLKPKLKPLRGNKKCLKYRQTYTFMCLQLIFVSLLIFKENKRILVLQDFRKICVISFYVKYTPILGRRATAEYLI